MLVKKRSLSAITHFAEGADDVIAHPVDVHVGSRIKLRRKLLGYSQNELAALLNVSFQQVQKYEKGINRVSASRLYEISHLLRVPVGFFFEDMPSDVVALLAKLNPSNKGGSMSDNDEMGDGSDEKVFAEDPMHKKEILELVGAFNNITDESQKKLFMQLVENFAKGKK